MKLSFDLSQYYLLFQAFDMAGRAMFRDGWLGTEWDARETLDASPISLRRAEISKRLADLRQRDHARLKDLNDDLTEPEREALGREAELDFAERTKLRAEHHELPEVTDAYRRDADAFKRRHAVETELVSAFRARDLHLVLANGHVVDWDHWADSDDFNVCWSLSMVRMPLHIMKPRRRAPAMIDKTEFNNWLLRFGPTEDDVSTLIPAERCRHWLRKEVAKGRSKNKSQYLAEALPLFDGLSKRAFNRVWDAEVPESWKASGPRRE